MFPDWYKVNALLVACSFEQSVAINQLEPAIQMLSQALPQAHIALLTSEAAGYRLSEKTKVFEQVLMQADCQQRSTPVEIIEQLCYQAFDAAIIFTAPFHSCYSLAYLCYLSGISIRLGQSLEFGGSVLSQSVKPPIDPVSPTDYHLHLLSSVGLSAERSLSISL
jgi:ADP-heptose:LPS heptosyltransferase